MTSFFIFDSTNNFQTHNSTVYGAAVPFQVDLKRPLPWLFCHYFLTPTNILWRNVNKRVYFATINDVSMIKNTRFFFTESKLYCVDTIFES